MFTFICTLPYFSSCGLLPPTAFLNLGMQKLIVTVSLSQPNPQHW